MTRGPSVRSHEEASERAPDLRSADPDEESPTRAALSKCHGHRRTKRARNLRYEMTSWWVVLLASGITALAAIGGSVAALIVDGRRAERRWHRDRRVDLYLRALSVLTDHFFDVLDDATLHNERTPEVGSVLSDLQILGSQRVRDAAHGLQTWTYILGRDGRTDENDAKIDEYWHELIEACRADLGVPS